MTYFLVLNQAEIHDISSNIPVNVYIDDKPYVLCSDEYFKSQREGDEQK